MTAVRRRRPQPDRLAEIQAELFEPMGPAGLRANTGRFETILNALTGLIGSYRPADAEIFRFPPVMSRSEIERSGYLKNFPNLMGCVSCLSGSKREIVGSIDQGGENGGWTDALGASDLVLTPASCYPLYPIVARRGRAPAQGLTFEVSCDCFRREPSQDVDRLQSFRMREFVRIGSEAQVQAFRSDWLGRAAEFAVGLGLPHTIDTANDPFFGRAAPFLAASQRKQGLKYELLVPIMPDCKPTACMSFNHHQDHLSKAWGLKQFDGSLAHTGCVGFGMDRLTLALFVHHGLNPARWPRSVRTVLQL